ncbi:hypothetical protein LTS15_005216 [Exophiala xenobiotica]|nr:hypothetical protein LTS15_005216 [Exophiala xenobiotica]
MRAIAHIAVAAVLALSIVSTIFVLLALTSPHWASQSYYYALNGQSDGTTDIKPLFRASRSPFYRCGIPKVPVELKNGTRRWSLECHSYRPYGKDKTSCRSAAEMGIPSDNLVAGKGLLGNAQECQQVHYAGNLQIAASVFITLGLIMTLMLVLVGVLRNRKTSGAEEEATAQNTSEGAKESRCAETGPAPGSLKRGPTRRIGSYMILLLLFFLYAGSLMQILAQFFGLLGLTINNSLSVQDVWTAQFNTNTTLDNFVAHAWVVDKGLSAYATVAWTSALLCAAIATVYFHTPRFYKVC